MPTPLPRVAFVVVLAGLQFGVASRGRAATATVYRDEAAYLEAAAATGRPLVHEGFEGSAWDGVRTTIGGRVRVARAVSSQGVLWQGGEALTTAPTGRDGWAAFDEAGGTPDAISGSASGRLFAVGAWFSTSTPAAGVEIRLDGISVNDAAARIDAGWTFLGVVSPVPFVTFELRGTEGSPADPKHWFIDDVSLVLADAPPGPTGVVPGVAAVGGLRGSDWHSDLFVHNASGSPTVVGLRFAPRGSSAGAAEERRFELAAGQTLGLRDVVASVFGSEGAGLIEWRVLSGDSALVVISAATFSRLDPARNYGEQVPAIRWDEAAPAGTTQVLPLLAGRYRSNLAFATDATCSQAEVEVFDREGRIRAVRTIRLTPRSWTQFDDVFHGEFAGLLADPDTTPLGESVHRVEVTGLDGRLVAYSSVVDNASNDPTTFVGQWGGGARTLSLPAAAAQAGLGGSLWRSDVILVSLPASVPEPRLVLVRPDGSEVAPETDVSLPAGGALLVENILGSLFGAAQAGVGSLRVGGGSSIAAWMRTYTLEGSGATYGQGVAPSTDTATVPAGGEGRIAGVDSGASTRVNLVVQNACADADGTSVPARLVIDILDAAGNAVASGAFELAAAEFRQFNLIAEQLGVMALDSGVLRVSVPDTGVTGASGGVDVRLSVINGNRVPGSNDARLASAQVVHRRPQP